MSGFDRYDSVLRLFDEARSTWTVQDMADVLQVPPSTAYRTVRDLVKAGYLEASAGASYRLGAAFVAYDRLIRLTDPLVRVGSGVLHEIVVQARVPCVGLLSRLFNDTVMCIADEATPGVAFRSSYQRGRLMPSTRGATSKAILAQLPPRKLRKLFATESVETAPFARGVDEFGEALASIRKRGYCISRGEIDPGLVGIAAPIVAARLGITASISLVVAANSVDDPLERRLTLLTVSSASLVMEGLKDVEALNGAVPAPQGRRG
jgi:DNA-binding IclR family transcriptional regulator